MMLITVADVFLRTFFGYPIARRARAGRLRARLHHFLALPAVFLRDEHLVVDVIDHLAKKSVVRLLDLAGAIVSLVVLAVMLWQMVPLARTMHEFGDVTSDLSLPKIWYWVPVLLGLFASALAAVVFIVRWRSRR